MRICVCGKYVPDSTVTNEIDPATKRLVREGVPHEMDPAALSAVEEGLRLVEKHGGSVTVVTMGPGRAEEGVRKALAMGAERGILVADPALAGSDALGTAKVLAAVLKREPFDLILCAAESTDSSSGLVPGMLAELLNVPQLTFAKSIELRDGVVAIQRQTEQGHRVVEAVPPVLVTISSGINEPRYPTLRGITAAKKKEVAALSAADLGLGPAEVGETGARERVLSVKPAPERTAGEIVPDAGEGGKRIADFLVHLELL